MKYSILFVLLASCIRVIPPEPTSFHTKSGVHVRMVRDDWLTVTMANVMEDDLYENLKSRMTRAQFNACANTLNVYIVDYLLCGGDVALGCYIHARKEASIKRSGVCGYSNHETGPAYEHELLHHVLHCIEDPDHDHLKNIWKQIEVERDCHAE